MDRCENNGPFLLLFVFSLILLMGEKPAEGLSVPEGENSWEC